VIRKNPNIQKILTAHPDRDRIAMAFTVPPSNTRRLPLVPSSQSTTSSSVPPKQRPTPPPAVNKPKHPPQPQPSSHSSQQSAIGLPPPPEPTSLRELFEALLLEQYSLQHEIQALKAQQEPTKALQERLDQVLRELASIRYETDD
jgi:hypothetical protein